ncbi:hypothetical protein C8A01DRAFT_40897 [Parachaetomium inaequale]|uniref:Uncharacterized protein n=1 Tax=Parachaetomium inaequale TaxID=2588326 RepID=A0AAN6SLD7_9PEZI|nr:hypothetical protein C8A01DRAFT_40897 [Parachaetomium inaequale]
MNPTPAPEIEPPSRLGGTNQRVFYVRKPQPGEPLPNFTRELRLGGGAVIREPPVRHIEELQREADEEEASGRVRLLGDRDAAELPFRVLLCDARRQVEEVEARANAEVRGVWAGMDHRRRHRDYYRGEGEDGEEWEGELERRLEVVLGGFREGVKGVYDRIAHLHGDSQAERVWETLGVKDRLPSEYRKIMSHQMGPPEEPMRIWELLDQPQPGEEDELDEWEGDTEVGEDAWEVHIDRGLRDDVAEEEIVVVSTLPLD